MANVPGVDDARFNRPGAAHPLRATLIYNAGAGSSHHTSPQELQAALREAGFDPVYRATAQEDDLDAVLADAAGVVVAAGGDGTVRAVAQRLVRQGRAGAGVGVTLAILPLGTANNIGHALGLTATPLDLARALGTARRRPFDVGRLSAPWGEEFFLEAAGCGLYADTLAAYDPRQGKSMSRALSALNATLGSYAPLELNIELDGQDLTGVYLLAEALNTDATGPRLQLAPRASTEDGQLDLVLVDADGQDHLLQYLRCLITREFDTLPSVRTVRGRRLTLPWRGQTFHVDGEVRPKRGEELPPCAIDPQGSVVIEVLRGALTVLVPAPPQEAQT